MPTGGPVQNGDPYDDNNIFAKILRHEIPSSPVYEDAYAYAFPDIAPWAPVHILVIPKGRYVSMADFSRDAPPEMIAGFWKAVGLIAGQAGLDEKGYRVITNAGGHSFQEVPHFHVHILGGRPLGPLLAKRDQPPA